MIRIQAQTCAGSDIGTGFLLSPTLVATVDHVVSGASQIELLQGGVKVATGTVIGEDQARDLALVRSNAPIVGYHFSLATRAPQVGESVAAFGFPLGLPLTVTKGSVSGLDRTIPIEGVSRRNLVQTDTALNPGNSGGPLISTGTGQVLGLVDAKNLNASGIGFAVSSAVAGPLLAAWKISAQPAGAPSCGSPAQAAPPPVQTPATSTATGDPVQSVYTYWSYLQLGEVANAYDMFSSNEQVRVGGLQRYVAGISQDPPQQVNVNLSLGSESGTSATVDVDSLQTETTSGCTNWTGSYQMVYENGAWLIDSANLSKSGC